MRELTLQTAALLESLGHRVEEIDNPVPASFPEHFLRYWSMLALSIVRARPHGLRPHLGPEQARQPDPRPRPARGDEPAQAAGTRSRVLRGSQRVAARHRESYDVTLTPTLATETPRVGHLRPDRDYDEIMDRLMDWVAFTPLQNATGDPAVSLPLATTAGGLPQGMMLGAGAGREARLLGWPTSSRRPLRWPRIQALRGRGPSGGLREPISHPREPCVLFSVVAPLAQSAERLHGKEKVYGSIP